MCSVPNSPGEHWHCFQNKSQNTTTDSTDNIKVNDLLKMLIQLFMTRRAGLQEAVDAVFVDLWGGLDVRVAVRKFKTWVPAASQTLSKSVKRDWCLSDLLSSNLLPLRLKRFRIHITSDRLDRDRAPPAANPAAVAVMLAFGAVESELDVYQSINAFSKMRNHTGFWFVIAYFTLTSGFLSCPVAMTITGQQLMSA